MDFRLIRRSGLSGLRPPSASGFQGEREAEGGASRFVAPPAVGRPAQWRGGRRSERAGEIAYRRLRDDRIRHRCVRRRGPGVTEALPQRHRLRAPAFGRCSGARCAAGAASQYVRQPESAILHFGTGGPTPTDARTLTAVAAAQDGFRLTHVGYRIRRVLQEGYGPQQLAFLTQGGFVLKSDYGDYYADARRQKPRAEIIPISSGWIGTTLRGGFPEPRCHRCFTHRSRDSVSRRPSSACSPARSWTRATMTSPTRWA